MFQGKSFNIKLVVWLVHVLLGGKLPWMWGLPRRMGSVTESIAKLILVHQCSQQQGPQEPKVKTLKRPSTGDGMFPAVSREF